MKGGSVTDSPLNVGVPRLCVGIPLVVHPVALLNGGVWCVLCCPVLGGSGVLYCPVPPFTLFVSPCIVLVSFLSCVVVFVVGGEV